MALTSLTRPLAALLGAAALGGCQSLQSSDNFLGVITPYRVEVVQGNVITREQAALVKPGMNPTQVRDLLGTPLLMDLFHAERWDYAFTINRQGAAPQLRRVVARFEADRLVRLETKRDAAPLVLTAAELAALPVPPKPAASPAEAIGPTRPYPPLDTQP
jgi:outer membrane protein assembly factor BamE